VIQKLFALAAVTSALGAIAFGAVLAWQTSDSARGAALVGSNGFEIVFEPVCDGVFAEPYIDTEEIADENTAIPCHTLIGPNGTRTDVGKGHGMNNGDFDLVVTGGEVRIRRVHFDDRECSSDDFSGDITVANNQVIPPGGTGGEFVATLGVNEDAPEDCEGNLVYYKVIVEAENP
jgi:hypothetical protein